LSSADHDSLKAFLSSRKEWFWSWRSSKEALKELERIQSTIRSDYSFQPGAFVTHREAKQLREVWVLAKCAGQMNIPQIRLSAEDPPDGYIKREGHAVPAEVLEIIEPGRKRNLEFGPDARRLSMDPHENWIRRAKAIPGALMLGIKNKKSKSYPPSTELFVYLNIGEYGIEQAEIEKNIRALLAEPIMPFGAIHVRWKGKIFSNGGAILVGANVDQEFDGDALWESIVDD
jgi:hypothetical protein